MRRGFLKGALRCSLLLAGSLVAASGTASADLIIDLTTAGSSGATLATIGGTFIVQQIDPTTVVTGVVDQFLRIQQSGSEQGYNTNASVEYNALAGIWTHALLLSDIPIVDIGGIQYRQFLLDINQLLTADPLLSLNQIQLFQSPADPGNLSDSLTPATATAPPVISFAGATEIFRMNNASDPNTEILLNYALNPLGVGDMFLYVRNDSFGVAPFVTMYSQFGTPGTHASNDGYEQWAVLKAPTPPEPVPEPASLLLLGMGLALTGYRARHRLTRT